MLELGNRCVGRCVYVVDHVRRRVAAYYEHISYRVISKSRYADGHRPLLNDCAGIVPAFALDLVYYVVVPSADVEGVVVGVVCQASLGHAGPRRIVYGSDGLAACGVDLVDGIVAADVDLPDVGSIEGHVAGPGAAEIGGPVPAGVRAIRSDNVVICWIDCAVGYHYLVGVEEHSDAPWVSYGRWADPALDHRTYVFRQPF